MHLPDLCVYKGGRNPDHTSRRIRERCIGTAEALPASRRNAPHAKAQRTARRRRIRRAHRLEAGVKRDVLPRRDGLSKRGGPHRSDGSGGRAGLPAPEMIVQRDVSEQDEPTWEVRQPNAGRSGIRRIDGRTRSILTVAAVAAIVVNAGAAWCCSRARPRCWPGG